MADIVDKSTRSRMMASIRAKDTAPEIWLRKILHAAGYRFRLHVKDLPGSPDIVMPRYRLAIFVNGCFWHGHKGCPYFRLPTSNSDFWKEKIAANRTRDRRKLGEFKKIGWRVMIVWECELRSDFSLSRLELPDQ